MSGPPLSSAGIPEPLPDDDDDVSWALQTAAVQWKRANYADAIVWLRRAADSAIQAGQPDRAADLIEVAAGLTDLMLEQAAKASASPAPPWTQPSEPVDDLLDAVDDEALEYEEVVVSHPPTPPPGGGFPAPPNLGFAAPSRRPQSPAGLPPPPRFPGFTLAEEGREARSAPPQPPLPPLRSPPPPRFAPSAAPARPLSLQQPPPPPIGSPPPPPRRPSKMPFEAALDRILEQPRQAREPARAGSRPTSVRPSSSPTAPSARPSSGPPPARASIQPDEGVSEHPHKRRSNLRALIEKLQQGPEDSSPPAPTPQPPRAASPATDRQTAARSIPPVAEAVRADRGDDSTPPTPIASERPRPAPEGAATRAVSEPATRPAAESEQPPPSSVSPSRRARGEASRSVLGVSLATVRGLEDLPEEAQAELVKQAKLEALKPEEECSFFAVALVVKGWVRIVPAISDAACAVATAGEVVFTKGNLPQGVALGVVAGDEGAFVAVWDQEALDQATASRPWVQEELRAVADRFQALAGAALGPLGERLDESLRSIVTERCDVRMLLPGEIAFEKGAAVGGMHVVGAGRIEIVQGEGKAMRVLKELAPGEFLFASQVLVASAAPAAARAGSSGALLLFASRHDTHELMAIVPPLVEILAG